MNFLSRQIGNDDPEPFLRPSPAAELAERGVADDPARADTGGTGSRVAGKSGVRARRGHQRAAAGQKSHDARDQFAPIAKPASRGSLAQPHSLVSPGRYRLQAITLARPGSGTGVLSGRPVFSVLIRAKATARGAPA